MKRLLLSLVLLIAASALHAMSYREAREYAYFLTDKMAYELNLTPEQYSSTGNMPSIARPTTSSVRSLGAATGLSSPSTPATPGPTISTTTGPMST